MMRVVAYGLLKAAVSWCENEIQKKKKPNNKIV